MHGWNTGLLDITNFLRLSRLFQKKERTGLRPMVNTIELFKFTPVNVESWHKSRRCLPVRGGGKSIYIHPLYMISLYLL